MSDIDDFSSSIGSTQEEDSFSDFDEIVTAGLEDLL